MSLYSNKKEEVCKPKTIKGDCQEKERAGL
jgi:hypothetical protein